MLLMRALRDAMKMVIKLYSALWCIGENDGKVG